MRTFTILLGGCLLFALAPRAVAHFRLLEPASWLQESELGDPQWSAPCGGTLTDPCPSPKSHQQWTTEQKRNRRTTEWRGDVL